MRSVSQPPSSLFDRYAPHGFDEMFSVAGVARTAYAPLHQSLSHLTSAELDSRHRIADMTMRRQGITFTVYGRDKGVERIMPFDPVPRIIPADEWDLIERGLKQRVRALNLFVHDVYHQRQILKDKVVPAELVLGASGYRREPHGISVSRDIYIHISGIDLIRDEHGNYLEVGRYIERIDMISRVLNVWFSAVGDSEKSSDHSLRLVDWTGLLRSCSAYEAYLKRYHERLDAESIVQYLVLDMDFPRSMRFCVGQCLESLRGILGGSGTPQAAEAERRLGRLECELRYADIREVFSRSLPTFLSDVQDSCALVVEEMQRAYFLY